MTSAITVNTRGNARICVPYALDQITTFVLLEQEDWFEDEIHFVRRCLLPGMSVVDVGANFGVYTTAMARAVGQNGRVWAFEPTPETADYLQATLDENRAAHVSLGRFAISDREGTLQFRLSRQPELNAVVQPGELGDGIVSVPAQTLDRLAAQHGWSDVAFVKLDVEGHERQAVEGGAAFFRSASPLVMFEVKGKLKAELGVLEPLRAMGYSFFRLVPGLCTLAPFDPDKPFDDYLLNLFACKEDRAALLVEQGLLAMPTGTVEAPAPDAWRSYVKNAAYAHELSRHWPTAARPNSAREIERYLYGLALYATSHDSKLSASARYAALTQAARCVTEAQAVEETVPRHLTACRLAWELGQRAPAVYLLSKACELIDPQPVALTQEPFLIPSPRYERKVIDAPPEAWVLQAVAEQFQKLRTFSSIYEGPRGLPLLDQLVRAPYCSPEMERRRQLIRIYAGTQSGPEPHVLLSTASEENLNPDYWNGQLGV
jgi:FkbM family methyltransferase